jgi:hypothetical protein
MRVLGAATALSTLALTLTGCWSDSKSAGPSKGGTTTTRPGDPARERMHRLFQSCRVRQTVSLHDGTLYLTLRDGSRVDLPKRLEHAMYQEATRLPRRCPRITASME